MSIAIAHFMMVRPHPNAEAVGHDVVLIVEDEAISRRALTVLLQHKGYSTAAVGSAEEAVQLVAQGTEPRFALIDLDLPGMNGARLIDFLSSHSPGVLPILITSASPRRLAAALHSRQVLYLRKPIEADDLLNILDTISDIQ